MKDKKLARQLIDDISRGKIKEISIPSRRKAYMYVSECRRLGDIIITSSIKKYEVYDTDTKKDQTSYPKNDV